MIILIVKLSWTMIKIGNNVMLAPTAVLLGDVELEDGVSVFDNAVLRGDLNRIRIGKNSNIQDNVTIHTERENSVIVGKNVSIGHNAVVHGARVDDNVIIGMGSVILNGSYIASGCIVGAGAVVKENFTCPINSIIAGIPATVKRSGEDIALMAESNGKGYQILRDRYIKGEYERKTGKELMNYKK
jgi:carbonic anhydrase/acetyltransferase-like protein (isoleucine patch superfamily)